MARVVPVKLAYAAFNPETDADEELSPIIFMHGTLASKEHWMDVPQSVANATKRKVYAVDARNHGDTEWTDVFNLDVNADDLLHFLDTIKAQKAVIVGHSMGGIAVIKAALKKPERIEKVIVEDIGVRHIGKTMIDNIVGFINALKKVLQEVTPEMNQEEAQNILIKGTNSYLQDIIGQCDLGKKRYTIPLKRGPDGRFGPKANIDVIVNAWKNAEKFKSNPEGLYEGPACFIYGTLSPFRVADDKDGIRKFFPKAEFVAIENTTHDVHTESPQEFIEALVKFVS